MSTPQPHASASASLDLKIDYNEGKIRAELTALAAIPGAERKAIARSVNRALLGTRTDLVADLRGRTVFKAGIIRKGISVGKAWWNASSIKGGVHVDTFRMPLSHYKISPLRITSTKGRLPSQYKALTYRLTKDGKPFDNTPQDEGGSKLFALKFKSGHYGVFYRLGGGRLPIHEESGPSLQFFVSRGSDQERILRGADTRFRRELAHQAHHLGGGGR